MGEEETVTEAVKASANGTCQAEETEKKCLTEKKEVDKNGVEDMEEDGNGNEKGESVKTDEGNDVNEEKSKQEEEEKVGVKADEENDVNEEKGKEEEEEKVDVKADEGNDLKEKKSKEDEEMEDVKADEEKDDSKEEKSKEHEEEEQKEEDVKNDEEKDDSKEAKGKEEEPEEDVKASEENESTEEKESEKVGEMNEEEDKKTKESKEEKEPTKRGGRRSSVGGRAETKKKEVGEKDVKEPVTPVAFSVDRPVRERKSVERLVAVIEKEPAREFRVQKGRGTALKDIPNVAFKLKRKRTDETFMLLHVMLFGRKGKAFKSNLSQFSGFPWHENEEKQKIKIKEKLDKFVKEKLLEFCDVLDIRVAKATARKDYWLH